MGNPDAQPLGPQEPRSRRPSPRTLALVALAVLILLFLYARFGLAAFYLGFMALFLAASVLGPAKARRLASIAYWTLLFAFAIALAFQWLAATASVQSLAERSTALAWLVGTFGTSLRASLRLGLILATLLMFGFLFASAWISSNLILTLSETSGMSRWDALKCLLLMTVGIWCPWAIVEDGEVKKVKPEGLLQIPLGPGIVVIRPGNAVVFEWGGKVTKIEGPGVAKSQRYEIIKKAVDLRPQWHSLTAEDVLTQDRVPLTFKMTVGYQIQCRADWGAPPQATTEASQGEILGDYPVYKESVYRAVFRLDPATPEKAVLAAADSFLRDAVRGFNLDGLYDYSFTARAAARGDAILALESKLKASLSPLLSDWGLTLLGADITTVKMPEEVGERVVDWWATNWRARSLVAQATGERQAMAQRGLGQAEALAAVEGKKEEIRKGLAVQLVNVVRACLGIGVKLDASVAVRLVSVLEAVSMRMTCDSPTAIQYLEALEKLLQSEGDKTLIVGESPPMFIRGGPRTGAD